MKWLGLMVVTVVTLTQVNAVSSCQEWYTWYVIPTEPPSVPTATCSENTTLCNFTLNELIDSKLNETMVRRSREAGNCHSIEIEFQSGSHIVKRNENHFLSFENTSSIIITGHPNASITCLDEFCLKFVNVTMVKIQSIHIKNCSCFGNGYRKHHQIVQHSISKVEIINSRFTDFC